MLELDVDRDEVEVDVVSRGRSGILGIGAEPARVRVSLISGSGGGAGAALGVVNRMLESMGVEARPTIRNSGTGPDDPTVIDIQGEDAGLIIGHRGETLRALQYIVNVVLHRQEEDAGSVVVDVEQYRERRQRQIHTLATRMAERAISSGQPVTLDPMTPADRRAVHVALSEDKGVTTGSSGEGMARRVTITPTGARSAARPSRPPSSGGRDRRSGGRPQMRDDRD